MLFQVYSAKENVTFSSFRATNKFTMAYAHYVVVDESSSKVYELLSPILIFTDKHRRTHTRDRPDTTVMPMYGVRT